MVGGEQSLFFVSCLYRMLVWLVKKSKVLTAKMQKKDTTELFSAVKKDLVWSVQMLFEEFVLYFSTYRDNNANWDILQRDNGIRKSKGGQVVIWRKRTYRTKHSEKMFFLFDCFCAASVYVLHLWTNQCLSLIAIYFKSPFWGLSSEWFGTLI